MAIFQFFNYARIIVWYLNFVNFTMNINYVPFYGKFSVYFWANIIFDNISRFLSTFPATFFVFYGNSAFCNEFLPIAWKNSIFIV